MIDIKKARRIPKNADLSRIHPDLRDKAVPCSLLTAHPDNPRVHPEANKRAIAGSLKRFQQRNLIVVNRTEAGLRIEAHHEVFRQMLQLGSEYVAVAIMEDDPLTELGFLLADNRTGDLSEDDPARLAPILKQLAEAGEEVEEVGWDEESLKQLLGQTSHTPDDDKEDDAPVPVDRAGELQKVWGTEAGQLWLIPGRAGVHRVLCGDSTKEEDVARLLSGESISFILADPPYFGKVDADWDNDFSGYEGFLDFLNGIFSIWAPLILDRGTAGWWCAPDFAWHVEGLLRKHFGVFNHIVWYKGQNLGTKVCVKEMRRWRPRSERLLLCEKLHSPDALLSAFTAKTSHIAARTAYMHIIDRMRSWQEEAKLTKTDIDKCLGTNGMAGHYFGRSQWSLPTQEVWDQLKTLFASRGVDIGLWETQRKEFDAHRREFDAESNEDLTDVWEMSAPSGEDRYGHPTPKPLKMFSKLILAHSRPHDLVADPFLGSGTTLIAAEQEGRICYGMERSPAYVAVILQRAKDAGMSPRLADA